MRWWKIDAALYCHGTCRRRHLRQFRSSEPGASPSAIDQHIAAASELQRRYDVIAGLSGVHLVVDQHLGARVEFTGRARKVEAPARRVGRRRSEFDRWLARSQIVLRAQRLFLLGAISLPVAETDRCGDQHDQAQRRPQGRSKLSSRKKGGDRVEHRPARLFRMQSALAVAHLEAAS